MVKTLRALIALAVLSSASAHSAAKCALNGARAVDDLMDAAVYIMASLVRCDKANGANADAVRCTMDVSASIEAVNRMINVVVDALDECDVAANGQAGECGQAAGVLTRASAGLASASAGIAAKCPNKLNHYQPLHTVRSTFAAIPGQQLNQQLPQTGVGASFGQCIVSVKKTMTGIFKAVKRIMKVKKDCTDDPDDEDCADNVVKLVAALSNIGASLAGALGECMPATAPGAGDIKDDAQCTQHSLGLVQHVTNVMRAGVELEDDCEDFDEDDFDRLYLANGARKNKDDGNSATFALAALIPVTAVVSFIGGSRIARIQARELDSESLQPMADVE